MPEMHRLYPICTLFSPVKNGPLLERTNKCGRVDDELYDAQTLAPIQAPILISILLATVESGHLNDVV